MNQYFDFSPPSNTEFQTSSTCIPNSETEDFFESARCSRVEIFLYLFLLSFPIVLISFHLSFLRSYFATTTYCLTQLDILTFLSSHFSRDIPVDVVGCSDVYTSCALGGMEIFSSPSLSLFLFLFLCFLSFRGLEIVFLHRNFRIRK